MGRRGSLPSSATGEHRLSGSQIARTQLEPHGHPEGFPLEVLGPGLHVAQVELDAESGLLEVSLHLRPDT